MEHLRYTGPAQRIDQRLTTQFLYSRSFFHKLIESEKIYVVSTSSPDRFVPKKSYMVSEGDMVVIETFLRYGDGISLAESPQGAIDIRHECDNYLVIYKPKGVLAIRRIIRIFLFPVWWGFSTIGTIKISDWSID